jgi:hypothetical protein
VMKKRKLSPEAEQHHDFLIYDLATALPDYLLAFHINKNLNMHFTREKDFEVHNPSGGNPETFSLYVFEEHENQKYYLVHNLKDENPLMKGYFMFIQGSFHKEMENEFIQNLRAIPDMLNVNIINLSPSFSGKGHSKKTIELINTLLTDLEYHISDLNREKTEQKINLPPLKKDNIKKLYNS